MTEPQPRPVPPVPNVSALIVDDEPLARLNLQRALDAFPRWQVQAACPDAASALAEVGHQVPDVVFLDIRMPGTSGLVLARRLGQLPAPPLVVFVTAYGDHAVEAFELHALDYLVKPFDDARFASGIQRIEALLGLRSQAAYGTALRGFLDDAGAEPGAAPDGPGNPRYLTQFCVKAVGRLDVVHVADVQWIAAAGNYARLHLGSRTVLHRVTLATLEARLDPSEFIRVHRTTIVRRRECRSLSVTGDGSYSLQLQCGARVPVSGRYVAAVRTLMADR
ncbi:MAG: LytR/AlgR family response regulator transcription factor [Gemmatimonadales bacterium]